MNLKLDRLNATLRVDSQGKRKSLVKIHPAAGIDALPRHGGVLLSLLAGVLHPMTLVCLNFQYW